MLFDKKKRKIIIILIIVLLLLLFCVIGINMSSKNEFGYSETKDIIICKDASNCNSEYDDYFHILKENFTITEVNDFIKKVNSDSLSYYNKEKKSNTSSSECSSEIKNMYYHSLSVDSSFYKAVNDKYISITVSRVVRNLCTDKYKYVEPSILIYSLEDNKSLTQEEFKKSENITDTMIENAIQDTLDYYNEIDGTDYKASEATDTYLFYGDDQNIHVLFLYPIYNRYETAIINK